MCCRVLGSASRRVRKMELFTSFGSTDDSNGSDSDVRESSSSSPEHQDNKADRYALTSDDVVGVWTNLKRGNYYPMWAHPKGYYLLINNHRFKRLAWRTGSEFDCERLKKTFYELGLQVHHWTHFWTR